MTWIYKQVKKNNFIIEGAEMIQHFKVKIDNFTDNEVAHYNILEKTSQ